MSVMRQANGETAYLCQPGETARQARQRGEAMKEGWGLTVTERDVGVRLVLEASGRGVRFEAFVQSKDADVVIAYLTPEQARLLADALRQFATLVESPR